MYSGGFGQSDHRQKNTLVYEAGDIKVNKRWSLPNGSFEWFAKMDTVTLKRMNIQDSLCNVEIDAHLDSSQRRRSFGDFLETTTDKRNGYEPDTEARNRRCYPRIAKV
jgi:hypothetical protein